MARPSTLPSALDAEIWAMRSAGMSQEVIAQKFSCTHRTIGRRLQKLAGSDGIIGRDAATLDESLRDAFDWFGSAAESAARSRRRGDDYDCERDIRRGGEGFLDGVSR